MKRQKKGGCFIVFPIFVLALIIGGYNSCRSTPTNPPENIKTSNTTNTVNLKTNTAVNIATPTPTETPLIIDLSTPKKAVLTHFDALKRRDVKAYMKTLSKKYLQEYEDIGQKVQLWEDKKTKVKRNAEEVIQNMFNMWNYRGVDRPAVFHSRELTLYGEEIKGRNAKIKIIVFATERVINLGKEGDDWKLHNFPLGNY